MGSRLSGKPFIACDTSASQCTPGIDTFWYAARSESTTGSPGTFKLYLYLHDGAQGIIMVSEDGFERHLTVWKKWDPVDREDTPIS
jgi:hypothetical protein